jgi:hypothetical protein
MPLSGADKTAAVMQLMATNAVCGSCIVGTGGDPAKVLDCADAAAKPVLAAANSGGSSSSSDFQTTFDQCSPDEPYVCTTMLASNLTFRCRIAGPESGASQPMYLYARVSERACLAQTHLPPIFRPV